MLKIFQASLQDKQPLATQLLETALARKSLANAYLLTGYALADKWLIAKQLACFLNCSHNSQGYSCLSESLESCCQNCQWISQGKHPQAWFVLQGEGASKKIPVEKARALSSELVKTSQYQRIIVIPEAEQYCFHTSPANALLKSIEEPGDNCLFMLFATHVEAVLTTIVSRSQIIPATSTFTPGLSVLPSDLLLETEINCPENFEDSQSKLTNCLSHFLTSRNYLSAVTAGQGLFKCLVDLSDQDLESGLLIDTLLAAQLDLLRTEAVTEPKTSHYLKQVLQACEMAKEELSHYVKKNHVFETLVYRLSDLHLKHLGMLA